MLKETKCSEGAFLLVSTMPIKFVLDFKYFFVISGKNSGSKSSLVSGFNR
jgi:hypothetical protein